MKYWVTVEVEEVGSSVEALAEEGEATTVVGTMVEVGKATGTTAIVGSSLIDDNRFPGFADDSRSSL